MKTFEGELLGQKGLKLYFQGWLPEKEIRAVIIIVHGIAEHSGRYAAIGQYLAEKGYAAFAMDHRHHGQSEGIKGRVDKFRYFVDDLKSFYEHVRAENPNKEIYILGHSMGAAIGLALAIDLGVQPAGLIISGAPLRANPYLPKPVIALLRTMAVLLPYLGLYKMNSSQLSKDPEVVDAYDHDHLVFRGKITAGLGVELLWQARHLEKGLSKIKAPILVLHGQADRVCQPVAAAILNRKASSLDKNIKIYPGLQHEILNEPERERVFADISDWLDGRL
jgi:acylglycerol lipase